MLGDHPVIERGGMFNAFLFDGFRQAVADAARPNLVIGGLVTEGCVLQTALGGLREGYAPERPAVSARGYAENFYAEVSK